MDSNRYQNKSSFDIMNDLATHFQNYMDSIIFKSAVKEEQQENVDAMDIFDKCINKNINGGADVSEIIHNIVDENMTGGGDNSRPEYIKELNEQNKNNNVFAGGFVGESDSEEPTVEMNNIETFIEETEEVKPITEETKESEVEKFMQNMFENEDSYEYDEEENRLEGGEYSDEEVNNELVQEIYNEMKQNIPLSGGSINLKRKIKVVNLYPFTLTV
jgi:hypothetical protein